jgi:hypothetical protein
LPAFKLIKSWRLFKIKQVPPKKTRIRWRLNDQIILEF